MPAGPCHGFAARGHHDREGQLAVAGGEALEQVRHPAPLPGGERLRQRQDVGEQGGLDREAIGAFVEDLPRRLHRGRELLAGPLALGDVQAVPHDESGDQSHDQENRYRGDDEPIPNAQALPYASLDDVYAQVYGKTGRATAVETQKLSSLSGSTLRSVRKSRSGTRFRSAREGPVAGAPRPARLPS